MKDIQTPIPWKVAKNKIEDYTNAKWKHKWTTALHYKHKKLFYDSPNKNKSKYILKMGTQMLNSWIKSITGHKDLAYFQSKLNPEIDPTCRLCLQANESHLTTDGNNEKSYTTTRYDSVSYTHLTLPTTPYV